MNKKSVPLLNNVRMVKITKFRVLKSLMSSNLIFLMINSLDKVSKASPIPFKVWSLNRIMLKL